MSKINRWGPIISSPELVFWISTKFGIAGQYENFFDKLILGSLVVTLGGAEIGVRRFSVSEKLSYD